MDKRTQVIDWLGKRFPGLTISMALAHADEIVKIFSFDPKEWAEAHKHEFGVRKIHFIKALRAAAYEFDGSTLGLKECKDIVEAVVGSPALAPRPSPVTFEPLHDEDGSEAFARMLERRAEEGTWFGTDDGEPPF